MADYSRCSPLAWEMKRHAERQAEAYRAAQEKRANRQDILAVVLVFGILEMILFVTFVIHTGWWGVAAFLGLNLFFALLAL